MIPGDIAAAIADAMRAAVAAGELPEAAASVSAAGTWHPVPEHAGGGPGSYGTSVPFRLAEVAGREPGPIAAALAERISPAPWIASARGTGAGYLTVTVTGHHLALLPERIRAAGPAAARSDVLAGAVRAAPPMPDLAAPATWQVAWHGQHAALLGRIYQAAGATVKPLDMERKAAPDSTPAADPGQMPVAVAYHGADPVRYALARVGSPDGGAISRLLCVPLDITNPFVAVRYAHAEAAAARRRGADLGLPLPPPGQAASGRYGPDGPRSPEPAELRLLDALSWLPERIGAAARRRRPAELPGYLEHLAGAWLDCTEACPALPSGGAGANSDPAVIEARIGLANAVRITLSAALDLLGIATAGRI